MASVLSTFWFFKDNFYGEERVLGENNDVVQYGDYMQVDKDHYAIWDKYRVRMGLPSRFNYDAVPRGRVLFHVPTHRFIVVGSKAITEDKYVQEKLIKYFGLSRNVEFRHDEHYR